MTTISDCYIECSGSFSRLIKSLGTPTGFTNERIPLKGIANEYSRFDVWAGSVGAKHFPHKRISLDYRLRDSSFYAARVVDILQRLDSTLKTADDLIIGKRPSVEAAQAAQPKLDRQRDNDSDRSSVTSSAESSSSDEADMMTPERQITALYESITNSVRHLYSLAIVIRHPVATDRLSRASKITVDHFISVDQRHVDECFPGASPVLKKRLAKAITRRRQLLMYNEQHFRKSSEPQPSEETTSIVHIAQDEPREKVEQDIPPLPVTSDPTKHLVRDTPSYAPTMSKRSLLASTEATKFIPPVDKREEPDVQSESGTITTFGFTGKDRAGLRVPPRPQDDNGEALEQFLCPLCYHLIEVKGERAWTRHVFRDLQAYVCTFDKCETPDILFETRQDWLRHEFENHRREWHCNDPKHKPHNSEREFIEHMTTVHELQLPAPQLLSLAKLCERSSSADTVTCPLCTDGCHDVVNGFQCYKPSWIIRQAVDYTCPESSDSEKSEIAKLPERDFNKITDSVSTKVTPWLISLPNDFSTDGNQTSDSTENSHQTHTTIGQRGPCFILSSDLKRHIGQHLERLALFAISRSKLMPDDGNSAHTEDAVARSETSLESLQSANSAEGYGYPGHPQEAANFASKMNITLVNLATYEAEYHGQMLDHVHVKLEETQRLIEGTLIESAFKGPGPTRHNSIFNPFLFSPEGNLESIITIRSVLSAICNPGETPNGIDPESFKYTVIYIVAIGKKLFSILVMSGLEGEKLWHTMDFFNKNNICDKSLPLEESDLRSLSEYLRELDGEVDTGSPEAAGRGRMVHKKLNRLLWSSELIKKIGIRYQWRFCAPVFSTEETIDMKHQKEEWILPFTERCTKTNENSYGQAIKYKIHRRHLVSNDMVSWKQDSETFCFHQDLTTEPHKIQNPVYVTVTRLSFEPMWQRELQKLKIIQALNQRHIVKLIATFRRGETDFYFISEASDGGSLRDFWMTFPRVLTANLVRSVIEQLYGLVHASFEVGLTTALFERSATVSNDDLNPENILWFKEGSGADQKIGTMKSCHQSWTTQLVSKNSLSAKLYIPPEQGVGLWDMMFPRDDIWAMGCITLEFMIWLLYGCEGLDKFHQDLESGSPEPDSNRHFWQSGTNGSKINPVVLGWMDHMAKDPVCRVGETALGDLLKLTKDRLFVVDVAPWCNSRPIDLKAEDSPTPKGLSNEQAIDNTKRLQKPTDESAVTKVLDPWNKHRELITKLYVQENKRIEEIQEIMETVHNFEASKRKYQRQLDKWLFGKGCLSLSRRVVEHPDARLWQSESIKQHRARPKEVCDWMHRILSGAKSESYWLPCPPLPPPDLSPTNC